MSASALPAGFEPLDFKAFHTHELPRRLAAGNGALAAEAAAKLGTLAIRLEGGETYSYVARAGGVEVVPGDADARVVVELSAESWQGLAHDLESTPGLIYAGRVKAVRGELMRFLGWEPALRALLHGRPIFDPERTRLEDRDGAPLDPTRHFRLDDDPEDMAQFLSTAGFLIVKQVFSPQEVARFLEAAAQLRREAVEGDKQSWWGKNGRGESVLCRVIRGGAIPYLRELHRDPRITRLAALSDESLAPRNVDADEGVTVLFKNPDMTEGLSDIPWHRDCGMGGHAVMCPILICTICLTSGRPEAGELRVLPGSWKSSYGFIDGRDPKAPRGVSLAAEAGDLSLHYGDLMHASLPPTSAEGPFRTSVLLAFTRPGATHHRGERSYNQVLLGREDGQVEHLSRVVERS